MPKEGKEIFANSTIDQGGDAAEGARTQPSAVAKEGREMNVRKIWKVKRMSFSGRLYLVFKG